MRATAWCLVTLSLGMCVGCESDLGACDSEAASRIVLSQNGLLATSGQALVHDSCGNGAFCHSSGAYGDNRIGAPSGMNFDMLPKDSGWRTLYEMRHASWAQVKDGHMPPGGAQGRRVLGDSGWLFLPVEDGTTVLERDLANGTLPAIDTREGKSLLRNWLACSMPTVAEGESGVSVQWPATPTGAEMDAGGDLDWADVHPVLRNQCALGGCHTPASAEGAGNLSFEDACGSYAELFESDGPCGMPRVSPGDDDSLLLTVMGGEGACDGRVRAMPPPPANPVAAAQLQRVRDWIASGAPSADCRP